MPKPSLDSLPDELLLGIVDHLDTARDVAHLSATTKTTRAVIERDGWCAFVKTHFSSLDLPVQGLAGWTRVAERATYLHRCWEQRALFANDFHEHLPHQNQRHDAGRRRRQVVRPVRPRGQSVTFRTVLDARLSPGQEDEVLAAGVGEDLVVRVKPFGGKAKDKGKDVWRTMEGRDYRYRPGTGDVTAVSVIERRGTSCVVAGRANGDLQLLSAAADDFGLPVQTLAFADRDHQARAADPLRKSPGQIAVSWTEWDPQSNLLASSRGSTLALHNLSGSDDGSLAPVADYDFRREEAPGEPSLVRGVKFMSKKVVACALGGSRSPLRWGNVLPTGIEFQDAMTKPGHGTGEAEFQAPERTTVRAIEPVGGSGSDSLLLSAWDDGTYRLMDIRTPSPHDALYRDAFLPNETSGSLLVYGTERFIAGGFHGRIPTLNFYDFRWPRTYYDSTAFPCGDGEPLPPFGDGLHMKLRPHWEPAAGGGGDAGRCDYAAGAACRFHGQSRLDYYRPDATVRVLKDCYDNIFSLAKASDLSESFYCGVGGGVLEMSWRRHGDLYRPCSSSSSSSAPNGWSAEELLHDRDRLALLETGLARCKIFDLDKMPASGLPVVHLQRRGGVLTQDLHRRLDASFLFKSRRNS